MFALLFFTIRTFIYGYMAMSFEYAGRASIPEGQASGAWAGCLSPGGGRSDSGHYVAEIRLHVSSTQKGGASHSDNIVLSAITFLVFGRPTRANYIVSSQ